MRAKRGKTERRRRRLPGRPLFAKTPAPRHPLRQKLYMAGGTTNAAEAPAEREMGRMAMRPAFGGIGILRVVASGN